MRVPPSRASRRSHRTLAAAVAAGALVLLTARVRAQVDPVSGIDFVTITHPGNAPWQGDGTPDDMAIGRGGVNYEYRIGRFEVTTAQYVEFLNAAFDRPQADWIPHLFAPGGAGFAATPTTPTAPGGRRWSVPAGAEMMPVGATDWRSAAIYANWLHNGKSLDRSAFLGGAYDVSTFGYQQLPNGVLAFTDQAQRSPGARYFIPTLDEWIKAAHWSPDRFGPGQPGYFTYSNASDSPYVGGLPPSMGGVGTANFGFDQGAFTVPLGAYTGVTSPWGLYDVAGGSLEWTESIRTINHGGRYRIKDGSYRTSSLNYGLIDTIRYFDDDLPNSAPVGNGLRIAAAVPAPSPLGGLAVVLLLMQRRRRGGTSCVRGSRESSAASS